MASPPGRSPPGGAPSSRRSAIGGYRRVMSPPRPATAATAAGGALRRWHCPSPPTRPRESLSPPRGRSHGEDDIDPVTHRAGNVQRTSPRREHAGNENTGRQARADPCWPALTSLKPTRHREAKPRSVHRSRAGLGNPSHAAVQGTGRERNLSARRRVDPHWPPLTSFRPAHCETGAVLQTRTGSGISD